MLGLSANLRYFLCCSTIDIRNGFDGLSGIVRNHLKKDPTTYFAGNEPLRTTLSQDDIRTFVMDEQYLIVIFQPYSVGGCGDGPFLVKFPFSDLQGHWNNLHPIHSLLKQTINSCAFTSSWDLEQFYEGLL